jgi:toxin YoeB
MRAVKFETTALDDMLYWSRNDLKLMKRIFELIQNIQQTPFDGIGKPEPLKHNLKGFWSRRIDQEHRLVYTVTDAEIIIAACRLHY